MSQRLEVTAGIRSWFGSFLVRFAIVLSGLVMVGCGDASRPGEETVESARESLISSLTVRLTRIYIGRNPNVGFYTAGVGFLGNTGPELPVWECPAPPSSFYGHWSPTEGQAIDAAHNCDPPGSTGLADIGELDAWNNTIYTLAPIPQGVIDIPVNIHFTDQTTNNHDFDWNFTVNARTGAVTAAQTQGNAQAATGGLNGEHSCARGPDDWMICWQIDTPGACVPSTEICDGIDNNCNGAVDEQFPFHVTCGAAGACAGSQTFTCVNGVPGATPCTGVTAPTPEICDGIDNNCNNSVDEQFPFHVTCGAAGACAGTQTFTCVDGVPGATPCTGVTAPTPEVPDDFDNDCDGQTDECDDCQACPTEVNVSNEMELREAIAQAALTPCKDVIVLAPGTAVYDVTTPLVIDSSMEIRGVGSSFGCQGVDLPTALTQSSLDAGLGSLRCDGDNGEDPGATRIRNVLAGSGQAGVPAIHRVMEIGQNNNSYPEVTLRHLTISGGFADANTVPGTGIWAKARRLDLFNVRVENNVARGPGAGVVQDGPVSNYPASPTFIMVNSTIRGNISTAEPLGDVEGVQGNGGGLRLRGVSFILRSTINDNAGIRGAGIFGTGVLHVYNSTITRNLAGHGGGGIYHEGLSGGLLELRDNTITNNFAQWNAGNILPSGRGAGVLVDRDVVAEVYGNVIADNVLCREGDPLASGSNGVNCGVFRGASFRSLGSNVGSADCGFTPAISLPGSGSPTSDTILDLQYARDLASNLPKFPDALATAVAAVCNIGLSIGTSPAYTTLLTATPDALSRFPSSDHEVFDRTTGRNLFLFGALASQGGPTQTIAPAPGSPALGAARTIQDPGITSDQVPSAPPLCPPADQRGFVVSDVSPPICDAGSYQSLATSALPADSAAAEMQRLFPDRDADTIADIIDQSPSASSLDFSDIAAGGVTRGRIVTRGNQSLRLFNAFPDPKAGILVLALSTGGTTPAQIEACNGTVHLSVNAGESHVLTCPQQPSLCLLATDTLTVGERVNLTLSGAYGGQVTFGPSSLTSSLFALNNVALTRATIGGDVFAGGLVTPTQTTIAGDVSQHAYVLARTLTPAVVATGTSDVIVGNDQTRSLVPGAYRSLVVADRAVLILAAGNYAFQSLTLRNDARVVLSGVVRVKTQSGFAVGDRVRITDPSGAPASGALTEWTTNAATVSLGHDVLWAGTIVAPSANLTLFDRARVDGCLAARRVVLNNDSRVSAQRFLPAGL